MFPPFPCLSAKSKLPSAVEDNCVNSTRLCICQMVISKEASHLCTDLTLCSVFSQLWFSGSLNSKGRRRVSPFQRWEPGGWERGRIAYNIAELASSGVSIHPSCTWSLPSQHQVCLPGCLQHRAWDTQ